MSRNTSSKNVEKNNRITNEVKKRRLSLELHQEEICPQIIHVSKLKPSEASEPIQDGDGIQRGELEYCCKLCPKKFMNKQALGGHQNAHKSEKVAKKRALEGQEGNSRCTDDDANNSFTPFTFLNSFNQDLKMRESQHPSFKQQQMHDHDFPGFVSPVSHEFGVMKLGTLCTSPTTPKFMSFQKETEQSASTSKEKPIDIAENDHSDYCRIFNIVRRQHNEDKDDIDLSLKL